MLAVAAGARQPRQSVVAVIELGMRIAMTSQATVVLNIRRLVTKREDVAESATGADVLFDITMTVQAGRRIPGV